MGMIQFVLGPVPPVNSALNGAASQVIGNKNDTIAGTSLVGLVKLNGFGLNIGFAVPAPDDLNNFFINQAIGNKNDTHDGNSIQAGTHTLLEHAHGVQFVYPSLAGGVVVAGGAGAWALGALVEIIPADTILTEFDIHYVYLEAASAADSYQIVLYYGAGDTEAGNAKVVEPAGPSPAADHPIQTPIIPANSRVRCAIASASGGADTLTISLAGHPY